MLKILLWQLKMQNNPHSVGICQKLERNYVYIIIHRTRIHNNSNNSNGNNNKIYNNKKRQKKTEEDTSEWARTIDDEISIYCETELTEVERTARHILMANSLPNDFDRIRLLTEQNIMMLIF